MSASSSREPGHVIRSAITFLMGSAVFLGLPLVAWGLDDIQGFMSHPARLGYIILVILLNAAAAARIPEVGKKRMESRRVVSRQHVAAVLMEVITVVLVVVAPYCDRRGIAELGGEGALRFFGLGLYVAGFLMMHWAESSLGKQFSLEVSILEDHVLVTNGPYRYLRHPRYLGVGIFVFGLSLLYLSGPALGLSVAMIVILAWRIRDEEALMHGEFGLKWEEYCQRSWRIIPFVF